MSITYIREKPCPRCQNREYYIKAKSCVTCAKASSRRSHLKNHDKRLAKARQWKKNNKGKVIEAQRKWKNSNPDWQRENRIKTMDNYLSYMVGRSSRKDLTKEFMAALLESQRGRCAVSGVTMTHRGSKCLTDVSLDRILPSRLGGRYTEDNVRLVCLAVNMMKWTMTDHQLKSWCSRIINNGEEDVKINEATYETLLEEAG